MGTGDEWRCGLSFDHHKIWCRCPEESPETSDLLHMLALRYILNSPFVCVDYQKWFHSCEWYPKRIVFPGNGCQSLLELACIRGFVDVAL